MVLQIATPQRNPLSRSKNRQRRMCMLIWTGGLASTQNADVRKTAVANCPHTKLYAPNLRYARTMLNRSAIRLPPKLMNEIARKRYWICNWAEGTTDNAVMGFAAAMIHMRLINCGLR